MSGIFGIFHRDGTPVERERLEAMREAMDYWGPDGFGLWDRRLCRSGAVAICQLSGSEARKSPLADTESSVVFTAEGRVDNRADLGRDLGIPIGRFHEMPDSEFMRRAFLQWGENCAARIYGDWPFAAWHPKEYRLFWRGDHFGNTSLYYYADEKVFAFATSRNALLSLDLAPMELDELYLGADTCFMARLPWGTDDP